MSGFYGNILNFAYKKCDFKILSVESNIGAPVLLNLLNSLRKSDKMLNKPHILSFFSSTRFINLIIQ